MAPLHNLKRVHESKSLLILRCSKNGGLIVGVLYATHGHQRTAAHLIREAIQLNAGDRLEVVHFVGGGLFCV
jgi:hypothetical protein